MQLPVTRTLPNLKLQSPQSLRALAAVPGPTPLCGRRAARKAPGALVESHGESPEQPLSGTVTETNHARAPVSGRPARDRAMARFGGPSLSQKVPSQSASDCLQVAWQIDGSTVGLSNLNTGTVTHVLASAPGTRRLDSNTRALLTRVVYHDGQDFCRMANWPVKGQDDMWHAPATAAE